MLSPVVARTNALIFCLFFLLITLIIVLLSSFSPAFQSTANVPIESRVIFIKTHKTGSSTGELEEPWLFSSLFCSFCYRSKSAIFSINIRVINFYILYLFSFIDYQAIWCAKVLARVFQILYNKLTTVKKFSIFESTRFKKFGHIPRSA